MDVIKLNNNFFLQIIKDDLENIEVATDIKKMKLREIYNKKTLVLTIDFHSFEKSQYKRILRHLLFIKSLLRIGKCKIGMRENSGIRMGYLINYDKQNKEHNDFIAAIDAILYDRDYDRYNYIYDNVCDYLDDFFYGKNLCDFKNNKCGEKRHTTSQTGCCHHFKPKWLGPLSPKLVLCEHLNSRDYTCDAKCISCKLFTCNYLEKKGVKFKIKDILLLDVFFNPIQKYFIKYMVFTPKEKIINRLLFFR